MDDPAPKENSIIPDNGWVHSANRLPVEVWHKILRIAISFPLLPRDDDDHLECEQIAQFNCETVANYKASETVRTQLRLVCRSWDHFLEEFSDRLVHLNTAAPDGHWPPVKRRNRVVRIEGIHSLSCNCTPTPCWPCFTDYLDSSTWDLDIAPRIHNVRTEYLPLLGNECNAISYPYTWSDQLLDPVRFSCVTFLTRVGDNRSGIPTSAVISDFYRGLTYLETSIITLHDPSNIFRLPHLRYLSISISTIESTASSVPIGQWDLPVLRYLILTLPRYVVEGTLDVQLLVDQIGLPVEEFVLRYNYSIFSRKRSSLLNNIWTTMPNLKLLGATTRQLFSLTKPTIKQPLSLSIEVAEILSPESNIANNVNNMALDWPYEVCGRILLDEAWHEVVCLLETNAQWWGRRTHLSVEVFNKLNAFGHGLYDRSDTRYNEHISSQISAALDKAISDPVTA